MQREHSTEGSFVLDAENRIVEWDAAASELFGVARDDALGRRCREVITAAAPVSAPCFARCPARHDLAHGRPHGSSTRRALPDGAPALTCRLTALPAATGGAVASVRAQRGDRAPRPAPTAADARHDLAAFASMATALAAGSLTQRLDLALDRIRAALAADAVEVFLTEPLTGSVVLTAHRGLFGRAFEQQVRFAPHEGVPGRVMAQRAPLVLEPLGDDARYVRDQVVAAGFQAYVCVPLPSGSGPIGTLSAAFRTSPPDLARRCRFLLWSAPVVATAVQAALAEHLAVRAPGFGAANDAGVAPDLGPDAALCASLRELVEAVVADGADVTIRSAATAGTPVQPIAAVGPPLAGRCPAVHGDGASACPALADGSPRVLAGGGAAWPAACRHGAPGGGVRTCLPIALDRERSALLRLWQVRRGRRPRTHALVVMEWRAREIERLLRARFAAPEAGGREVAVPGFGVPAAAPPLVGAAVGAEAGPLAESGSSAPGRAAVVRCFGDFELRLDGASVAPAAFRRRKATTLFKVLLLHDGRVVDREVLIEALWPGADPDRKMGQLHGLVHELRRVLGHPGAAGEAEPVLGVEHVADGYRLRLSAAASVDLRDFERARRAAGDAVRRGDVAAARRAAEQATELYRGSLFDDDRYAEWCGQDRERLHEACLELRTLAAHLAGDAGDWGAATRHWRAASQLNPLREDVSRGLMGSLWHEGKRDQALEQYRHVEARLRRELDVDPLPATVALAHQIRDRALP